MARASSRFAPTHIRARNPAGPRPRVAASTRVTLSDPRPYLRTRGPRDTSRALSFREVIVPLDGSPYAEHALPWAIQLAHSAGARVRLVHVHPRMQPGFHERGRASYCEFDRLLREPMEEYMADLVRRLARSTAVPTTPTVVDGRDVADHLSELFGSTSDIVVMATRGRNVVSRFFRASPLDAVVSRREAPILHVRGYACPVDLTARPSLRRALAPLDGSAPGVDALPALAALSRLTDGRQTLLQVIQSPGAFSCVDGRVREDMGALGKGPVAYLDTVATAWRHELPHVRTSVVWSDKSPAQAIAAEAEAQRVDFIALATRPRTRLSRLLRPGVVDRLIRRGRIPILVVKQRNDDAFRRTLAG